MADEGAFVDLQLGDMSKIQRNVEDYVKQNLNRAGAFLRRKVMDKVSRTQPVAFTTTGKPYGLDPSQPGTPPKQVTGTLHRNIIFKPAEREGNFLVVYVGVPRHVPYGPLLEFGFDGVVTIPSHTRRVEVVYGKRLPQPVDIFIPAHTRRIRIEARPFLRSTVHGHRLDLLRIVATGRMTGF